MSKRLNVEKRIKNAPFSAKIGTVDRLNPASLYVTGKMYITPKENRSDYGESIKQIKTNLDRILRRFTGNNTFLNRDYISNLEVAKNGIKYGKNSYLFFQIIFSQKFSNEVCKNMDEINKILTPGVLSILNEFNEDIEEHGFMVAEKCKIPTIYS